MQFLDPLAVPVVGLAASRHSLELSRIDQQHFQPPLFQQVVQRHPIQPRTLHGHRLDAFLLEPIGQRLQFDRRRCELPNVGLLGFPLRTADPVLAAAQVDSGGIRTNQGQTRPVGFLLALFLHGMLHSLIKGAVARGGIGLEL